MSCRGAAGELICNTGGQIRTGLLPTRWGQQWGQKNKGVSSKETVQYLITDFTEEKYGGGAGFEPATFGL